MLEIGQIVNHNGHGQGTVIAYNGVEPVNEYAINHLEEVPNELMPTLAGGFYSGDRYPYVVLFDSGFQEVYSDNELEIVN